MTFHSCCNPVGHLKRNLLGLELNGSACRWTGGQLPQKLPELGTLALEGGQNAEDGVPGGAQEPSEQDALEKSEFRGRPGMGYLSDSSEAHSSRALIHVVGHCLWTRRAEVTEPPLEGYFLLIEARRFIDICHKLTCTIWSHEL